jgi:SAM-dependent methyltransferase
MDLEWMPDALGFRPRTWINIHAGFDETTVPLQRVFGGTDGRAFDVFDRDEMTESSIARARKLREHTASESVDFRHLPVNDSTLDAAMLLLSAHELRTDDARCALLGEIRRALTAGGRIVVAEHLRDAANFAAFGPGFLHFHSRRTWMRCFARVGLVVRREFSIAAFVRVFVLEKNA